jgi:amidase
MPGQEGVKACYSPMTRSLDSLSYFLKAVIDQKPWDYDPSCDPIPWRTITLPKTLNIGVLRDDGISICILLTVGVVRPSPACLRALELALSALSQAGHTIVPFEPPSPEKALKLASQLLLADGGRTTMSHYKYGQENELGLKYMIQAMRLPRWVKWIWAKWIRFVRRDNVWADLVEDWHEKSGFEQQKLVVQRYV